ncbi:MAG: tetratricopeptide repeat protein, partial [candidate division Zixibacteria bacterium]|nr:tetratricopeptide repeat protein [candidate division KSB1 bacterium]NIV08107.1 tetratricopeptide repeat protein [candidate division Zixibacteria bacterium]NIT73474.1 tetratricopeptide repeat protein [candidate division KSB1 bacterium]NIU27343.1 tetratricopeptide repeat protein [candidate division KSB1 bacterium]NIW21233.1 tetratricopeptide repeat protein [candidate division KSB1 bacterium]
METIIHRIFYRLIWLFVIGMILFYGCQSQNSDEGIPAYQVSFRVIPQTLPDSATVYISGNITPLGNRAPALAPMTEEPDGSWTKSLLLPQDLILEYRFDLGDVLSEAVGKDSLPLGRMSFTVKKDTVVIVHVANWKDAVLSVKEKSSPSYQAERFFRRAEYLSTRRDYEPTTDSARYYYRKAMELFKQQRNWQRLVICNYSIAAIADDFDQRLRYYNRALALAEKHLGKNHDETGRVLYRLGSHYSYFGDYNRALTLAQRALDIHLANHGEVYPQVFGDLSLIGSIYRRMKKYDKAIEYRQRALNVLSKIWGPTHQDVGNSYKALGKIYADMGEFDKAIEFYERARKIHAFYNDEISVTSHMSYLHLGEVYMLASDYEEAKACFEKALEIRQKMYGKFHGHIARAHLAIAKASFMEKDYENAINQLQKSLKVLFPGFDSADVYVNPLIESVSRFRPAVFNIFVLKGKVLQGMALQHKQSLLGTSEATIKKFETALDCYDDALRLAAIGLGGILTTNAKLHLQTKLAEVVEQAINSAQQLYDITGNRAYLVRAFEFNERGKSVLLRLALQQSEAKSFSGIDDEILQEEEELSHQIAALEVSVAREKQQQEPDKEKISELEAEYHQLKSEHEFLLADLEQNYPRYYELKYQLDVPPVSVLQDVLDDDAVLLDYFVGDSSIHIFIIAKEFFKVVSMPRAENFDSLVTTLSSSIRRIVDARAYLESAAQLYKLLIRPV